MRKVVRKGAKQLLCTFRGSNKPREVIRQSEMVFNKMVYMAHTEVPITPQSQCVPNNTIVSHKRMNLFGLITGREYSSALLVKFAVYCPAKIL
jgi:hypothetical protein